MTLERARILKNPDPAAVRGRSQVVQARVVQREVLAAREEAGKIVAEAKTGVVRAIRKASNDAREAEVARLSAVALELRAADERRAERDLARTIDVAKLLAERLLGAELTLAPSRIAELAAAALEQTRGARRLRLDANPEDAEPLRAALGELAIAAEVTVDAALARGSLVLHTELGDVDARLTPQLDRLAEVLREAMTAKEQG